MTTRAVGRKLLIGVAVVTATNGYLADWNRTHLFNPRWPPHAKFHDGTILLASALLGTSALIMLWRRRDDPEQLAMSAWLLAIFWLSLGGSVLFPGAADVDPEYAHLVPRVAGLAVAPTWLSIAMLLLTGLGYTLERSRLRAEGGQHS